jgi:hypothetical protein
LSRSSFIFCLTALNILSIISFIESALSTGISLLQITPFPVFISFYPKISHHTARASPYVHDY